jgi:transcriptional regulator with XRE-family HTH domain
MGWTLENAGEQMGLDFRHLQQVEAGTVNITLATIVRIADAFDVSPFVILPISAQSDDRLRAGETNSKYGKRRRPLRVAAIRAEAQAASASRRRTSARS